MYLRRIIFITLLLIFSTIVIVYGFYKALPIILGPKVELISPKDNVVAEGTTIDVKGKVYRTKQLLINSIITPFSEDGSFNTKLAIYPGSNILIIDVKDRFGRVETITRNIGTKN